MFGLSKLMRSKAMRWIAVIATGATTALGDNQFVINIY